MTSSRRTQRPAAPWLRVLGMACAGLVVFLALGAHSPDLHAWVHGGDHHHHTETGAPCAGHAVPDEHGAHTAPDDDGCAIVLFSHGIVTAVAAIVLLARIDTLKIPGQAAPDWIAPVAPRFIWLRTHAPPSA